MIIFKRLVVLMGITTGLLVFLFLLFEVNPAGANQLKIPFLEPNLRLLSQGITPTTVITNSDWFIHFETPSPSIDALDCPLIDFCKTISSDGDIYTWNGIRWEYNFISDSPFFTNISCLNPNWCKISGVQAIWSWDGLQWIADEIPAGYENYSFEQIECVNEQFCLVFGRTSSDTFPWFENITLQWDGTTWAVSQAPGSYVMDCISPTYCKGVTDIHTSRIYHTIHGWNGVTTTLEMTPTPYGIYDLHCLSEQFCKASWGAGGSILSWNGIEWQVELLTSTLPATETVLAVACGSTSSCKAVSEAGTIVSWNGSTWEVEDSLMRSARGATLACPAVTNCYGWLRYEHETEERATVFGMYQQTLEDVGAGFALDISPTIFHPSLACLTRLKVTQVAGSLPTAPAGIQTGRYWAVDAPCPVILNGTLTLPSPITPTTETRICYQVDEGSLWQCQQDSFTAETITINTQFWVSNWFIGVPDPSLTHTVYLPVVVTE